MDSVIANVICADGRGHAEGMLHFEVPFQVGRVAGQLLGAE